MLELLMRSDPRESLAFEMAKDGRALWMEWSDSTAGGLACAYFSYSHPTLTMILDSGLEIMEEVVKSPCCTMYLRGEVRPRAVNKIICPIGKDPGQ